jgi:phage FluMu gp28-like protein
MFPQAEIFTRPQAGKKYFAGIDIGRNRDLTCIWICEDVSTSKAPMLITRHIETMSKVEFAAQEKRIAETLTKWKPRHCMIDGTNVGAMLAENLEKRFSFCQAIKITSVTRPRWISDWVSFIQRDPVCLQIPNSNEVWEDFLSVERYFNKHGAVDFFIPSHGNRGHGDRAMSMVLCLQAFLSKRSLSRYTLQSEGTVEKVKPHVNSFKKPNVRSRFRM